MVSNKAGDPLSVTYLLRWNLAYFNKCQSRLHGRWAYQVHRQMLGYQAATFGVTRLPLERREGRRVRL